MERFEADEKEDFFNRQHLSFQFKWKLILLCSPFSSSLFLLSPFSLSLPLSLPLSLSLSLSLALYLLRRPAELDYVCAVEFIECVYNKIHFPPSLSLSISLITWILKKWQKYSKNFGMFFAHRTSLSEHFPMVSKHFFKKNSLFSLKLTLAISFHLKKRVSGAWTKANC